ncbi:MAG: DUF4340 domain-containing protein [Cyclobacteriaceae bacterium]|nr:DUF4340 domain-containing protein [Cyclobacteriaceae bacterium]
MLLSLVILTIISVALFLVSGEDRRPEIDPAYFNFPPTEKTEQVTLLSKRDTVDLRVENNRWKVNEGWDADAQMIKALFATLRQVVPKRPVAASIKDSVSNLLRNTGTLVRLISEGQSTEFLVGGNTAKTETWFLKSKEDQPYTVVLPGYRVYVGGIFELEKNGWRNKRAFDFNWRNFRQLTATYAREPAQGFIVEMKDRYFGIQNMQAVDTAKLNSYLDAVSLLFAERFIPTNSPMADSLVKSTPSVKIQIQDIGKRTYSLELFTPRPGNPEVFGRLGDGEWVSFAARDLAGIVRKRDYFKAGPDLPK